MKKNKITSYFVFISFLTLVTIFFSIVQKSYFSFRQPQTLVENNVLLKEINPKLDLSVISTIESKNENTEEPFDFSIIKSSKPTEDTIIPAKIEPIITPTSTSAGTLNKTTP